MRPLNDFTAMLVRLWGCTAALWAKMLNSHMRPNKRAQYIFILKRHLQGQFWKYFETCIVFHSVFPALCWIIAMFLGILSPLAVNKGNSLKLQWSHGIHTHVSTRYKSIHLLAKALLLVLLVVKNSTRWNYTIAQHKQLMGWDILFTFAITVTKCVFVFS